MNDDRTEIAQRIVDHLLKQRVVSRHPEDDEEISNNGCAYRGSYGAMCAVGCLINDDVYDPQIEYAGISNLVYGPLNEPAAQALQVALHQSHIPTDPLTLQMLWEFQRFHDTGYTPELIGKSNAMFDQLEQIKRDHRLESLDLSGWKV